MLLLFVLFFGGCFFDDQRVERGERYRDVEVLAPRVAADVVVDAHAPFAVVVVAVFAAARAHELRKQRAVRLGHPVLMQALDAGVGGQLFAVVTRGGGAGSHFGDELGIEQRARAVLVIVRRVAGDDHVGVDVVPIPDVHALVGARHPAAAWLKAIPQFRSDVALDLVVLGFGAGHVSNRSIEKFEAPLRVKVAREVRLHGERLGGDGGHGGSSAAERTSVCVFATTARRGEGAGAGSRRCDPPTAKSTCLRLPAAHLFTFPSTR